MPEESSHGNLADRGRPCWSAHSLGSAMTPTPGSIAFQSRSISISELTSGPYSVGLYIGNGMLEGKWAEVSVSEASSHAQTS